MSTLQLIKNSGTFTAGDYCKTQPLPAREMKAPALFDFDKWELDNLVDYIIENHHCYVKKNTVVIYDLAREVATQHGENHPELLKLTEVNFFFFHDLLNHLRTEEQILIPNIKRLIKRRNYEETNNFTTLGLITDTIMVIQKEHLAADKYFKLIHILTDDYRLPIDACNSYKYLFRRMKEFENNMVLYIHLENDILFPKAVALEEQLRKEEKI